MKRLVQLGRLVALVSLALLLSGCAQRSASPVELTQEDDGASQMLSAGQELSISLDANPTTGYVWAVDGELPSQLEQVGEPEYTAESSALGAGGTEVWVFRGIAPGEGTSS